MLTEADSHLGLANRLLARRARRVCLAFPIAGREGERYLVTGRPVPAAVLEADRDAARRRFGIAPDARCLLVVGGSQGARSINFAALEAFAEAGRRPSEAARLPRPPHRRHAATTPSCRTGSTRLRTASATPCSTTSPTSATPRRRPTWSLGRSGGSIFEVAAAGRPAILVPYPHATADHQSANAELDGARAGAAVGPRRRRAQRRAPAGGGRGGCSATPTRLEAMAAAARGLARPDAARRIADEVLAARRR